ncbi:transposase domain-containing protein [Embleya sp. MST-111070]|uniref:transposase domain-containing protein n=1 Tax=Embleya sp. MST-111070 TaxID=3398231 RepID=UPI003F73375F
MTGRLPGAAVLDPGHLGELTRYAPFDLVDAVLAESGRVQRRVRSLPSRVGVCFMLALGLFPRLGYARAWEMLTSCDFGGGCWCVGGGVGWGFAGWLRMFRGGPGEGRGGPDLGVSQFR